MRIRDSEEGAYDKKLPKVRSKVARIPSKTDPKHKKTETDDFQRQKLGNCALSSHNRTVNLSQL